MKQMLEISSHHLFASQSVKSSQSSLQCLRIGADVRVVLIKVAFKWVVGSWFSLDVFSSSNLLRMAEGLPAGYKTPDHLGLPQCGLGPTQPSCWKLSANKQIITGIKVIMTCFTFGTVILPILNDSYSSQMILDGSISNWRRWKSWDSNSFWLGCTW